MAETSSLLNCRTRKGYRGFESPSLREQYKTCYPVLRGKVFKFTKSSGCSVARLARLLWEQEVASSNLATPTNKPKPVCEKQTGFFNICVRNLFRDVHIKKTCSRSEMALVCLVTSLFKITAGNLATPT